MYQNATEHGLTIVNPIDRFVEFINLVSARSSRFKFALKEAGAYDLVSEVHSGFYDFISATSSGIDRNVMKTGRNGPTIAQRRQRLSVCTGVQERLVVEGAVPAADLGRTPILSPSSQRVVRMTFVF